jgi:hypothetical protein
MTRREAEALVDAELLKHGLSRRDWYRTIYLKSGHWRELRSRALEHHGRKCHKCPATRKLDVHHIRYSSIYDVEVTDLQILCRTCHDKEHLPAPKVTTAPRKRAKKSRGKPKRPPKPTTLSKKQWRKLQAKMKIERVKERRKRGCAPHKPPAVTVNGVRLFKP